MNIAEWKLRTFLIWDVALAYFFFWLASESGKGWLGGEAWWGPPTVTIASLWVIVLALGTYLKFCSWIADGI